MQHTYIKNGTLITKDAILKNSALTINGGKIESIGRGPAKKNSVIIDAKGLFVSPGFIDCHIHGDPRKIFRRETQSGTTSIALAVSCCPLRDLYKKIDGVKRFVRRDPLGPQLLGVHLEGPYINSQRRGAQRLDYIRRPDKEELLKIIAKCRPLLKIMTLAPELEGALGLVRILKDNKVMPAIGHSNATYEEADEAIRMGSRHATHLFNAMSGRSGPDPGVVGACILSNRVSAEIILDLIHVHPALFEAVFNTKKRSDIILVTDSVAWERSPSVRKRGGVFRLPDGTIAGSALTMIKAVENAVKKSGLSLVDVVRMAALNPARLLGVEGRKGSLEPGKDADIVVFDKNFHVKMTVIGGRIAYSG